MKREKKRIISPFAALSVLLFIIIGVVYLITDVSAKFADLVNSTAARSFRLFFVSISSLVPFSVFELFMLLLPIIVFLVIRGALKSFDKGCGIRYLINLAAVVLLIYTGHIFALGIAHNTTTVDKKMSLTETEVTAENLAETLTMLRDEINALATTVPRNSDGVFDPEYSFDEISEGVSRSYDALAAEYGLPDGFDSRAKGVVNSWAMSYLGISGIFTYPTGEANVNSYYPAYVTIFTSAHEMCHQRGILRENEANFLAFLITFTSDDDNFRYSGALNIYSYFASALYRTDKELYFEINSELSPLARVDINAANKVTEKYGDTIIEDISEWINDFYLESSGSGGIVSYSRVVELVLAYYNTDK
ncbi:MAG: DUF3810 domain-containing protein [Clostridia bacterium]|nr:DUF3810 domain-containing protein [Clostridia bacterium]